MVFDLSTSLHPLLDVSIILPLTRALMQATYLALGELTLAGPPLGPVL